MGFLASQNLWLLLLIPVLVLVYLSLTGRLANSYVRFPNTAALALALPGPGARAHFPAMLFGAALLVALLAFARPTLSLPAPQDLAGVVIAIETGFSMRNSDIAPSRIEATKKAARDLVSTFPRGVQVGLATFSNFGTLNLPLTTKRQQVIEAIDLLDLGNGYSFTYGIAAALDALPENPPQGVSPGAIVLYSHGHDATGNSPLEVATQAAKRGIRIYTVGVGVRGNNFNENALKQVADLTGGRYYPISSAAELKNIYRELGRLIAYRPKPTEVSGALTLLAGLLLAGSLFSAELRRKVV